MEFYMGPAPRNGLKINRFHFFFPHPLVQWSYIIALLITGEKGPTLWDDIFGCVFPLPKTGIIYGSEYDRFLLGWLIFRCELLVSGSEYAWIFFLVIFDRFYHGIHHHFSSPFEEYVLFFPNRTRKSKHASHFSDTLPMFAAFLPDWLRQVTRPHSDNRPVES